jgi:hypothetical protein
MSLKQWLTPASTSTSAKRKTKNKPRRKAPAIGSHFELLENRTVPAFLTSGYSAAGVSITGDGASDNLTITASGGLLQHNRFTAGDAGFADSFDWDTSTAGSQHLNAIAATTINVDLGGGDDTLQLGTAALPASTLFSLINFNFGGAGNDNLIVNDSGGAANTWNYTSTTVTATGFNLDNTAIVENGEQYILSANADTFNVNSTFNALAIQGTSGADVVNIGNAGSVQGIASAVTVANTGSFTALTIDDSADATGRAVTVTNASVTGLAPAAINYAQSDLRSLTVNAGNGGNTFAVTSTPGNAFPVVNSINSGTGSDTYTIAGSGLQDTNIFNGGTGNDTFNLNGYAAVGVGVTISGKANTAAGDTLIFDAQGAAVNYSPTTLSDGTGKVVNYDTIENLTINNAAPITINGDGTANTLLFTSVSATTATFKLDAGPTVAIGGTPFTFNGLGGDDTMQVVNNGVVYTPAVNYNGGAGSGDRLLINGNLTAAGAGTYTTGPGAANEFSGTVTHTLVGTQTINFTGLSPVEDLTVQGSMTINDAVVGGAINIIQGPISVQNDPLTGAPATTYEVNFAGAAELFRFRNRTNVIINGDNAGNQVLINVPTLLDGPGSNALSVSPLTTLTVNSGTGADTVGVRATPAGVITTVNGNDSADTVVVGSLAPLTTGGVLTAITGELRIKNTLGFSAVTIDDSGDAVTRNATLDTVLIGAQTFGRLTNLGNTGAIEYGMLNTNDMSSVTINGGSGGNTILVNQVPGAGSAYTTTLNSGTGVDTVNIQATSNLVTYIIQGQNGDDNVNVGDTAPATLGKLTSINGVVEVDNTLGKSQVTIDASGDATAAHPTALIDSELLGGNTFGRVTGLGNAAEIRYRTNTRQMRNVIVNSGTLGDIITINQTLAAETPYLTTVNSGGGNDTFVVKGIALNNNYQLNGQGGNDTFQIVTAPVAGVSLDINGSAGGQTDTDTLIGPDINNTWSITGPNAGKIVNVVTSFQSIENLTGGTAADNFVFNPTGSISGTIDGKGTNDILDFSALPSQSVALRGVGTVDGFNGSVAADQFGATIGAIAIPTVTGFLNINTIISSTVGAADALIGTGAASNWVLTGPGAGTYTDVATGKVLNFSKFEIIKSFGVGDTLTGPNTVNTWNITGVNSGNVAGTSFIGMANLNGGSLADTFNFTAAGITGVVDGQGFADSINFAGLASQAVVLTGVGGTDGFNGTAPGFILGGFKNINAITGSAAGVTDSLTGLNTNSIWTVTTGSSTYQDIGSGRVFTFSNFETLNGGSGNDQFTLVAPVPAVVTLNGGVGVDTLTGANLANLWQITGVGSGAVGTAKFAAFENFVGGTFTDTFQFGVAGFVPGTISGAGGENWLDYSLIAGGITVNFSTGTASLVAGGVSGIRNALGSIAGGDTLTTGPTGGVLVGKGTGNTLRSTGGPSILIAGIGVNKIFTGSVGDIAIAGFTLFDGNTLALASMLAEWQSGGSYATRIAHLQGAPGGLNGPNFLFQGGTVFSPAAPPPIGPRFGYGGSTNVTTITAIAGGLGQNWYFTNYPTSIVNKKPTEQIN